MLCADAADVYINMGRWMDPKIMSKTQRGLGQKHILDSYINQTRLFLNLIIPHFLKSI